MTVKTTTHINFRGNARAALEFYHATFGGQLTVVTYKDMGAVQNPAEADQIMWGKVEAESGDQLAGPIGWTMVAASTSLAQSALSSSAVVPLSDTKNGISPAA